MLETKKAHFQKHSKQSKAGQGVIEYAGALVIAAVIVSAGIIIVPPNFAALFETISTTFSEFLTSQL